MSLDVTESVGWCNRSARIHPARRGTRGPSARRGRRLADPGKRPPAGYTDAMHIRIGSSNASNGGIGVLGLLAILFIGLKLGGVIAWSWWWVLAPIWIPLAIVLAIVLAVVGGLLCWWAWADWRRRRFFKRRGW